MRAGAGSINWLLTDHLGSTAVTTNSSGAATAELRYMPYGTSRYASGTQQTTYRYTGQRIDTTTDLYYYGSRWYDSVVGRFVQPDSFVPEPGNPQSLNRYSYVLNNPMLYADPSGHRYEQRATVNEPTPFSQPAPTPYDPAKASATSRYIIADQWYNEQDPETQWFGPSDSFTQDVRHDPLTQRFYAAWQDAGYPSQFEMGSQELTIDVRDENVSIFKRRLMSVRHYLEEHSQQALAYVGLGSRTAEGPVDTVGGTTGSFDSITVSPVGSDETGTQWVQIRAFNVSDWASATRWPGENRSLRSSEPRSAPGKGGNCYQYFYWYEPIP